MVKNQPLDDFFFHLLAGLVTSYALIEEVGFK